MPSGLILAKPIPSIHNVKGYFGLKVDKIIHKISKLLCVTNYLDYPMLAIQLHDIRYKQLYD
jgi:hypothetical protein